VTIASVPILAAAPGLVRTRERAFWGLFAVAAAIFVLDGLTTMAVLSVVPSARETNPVAALALAAGPLGAFGLKAAIVAEVALTATALRRLDAEGAGRFLFYALAAAGAWGVGTALGVAIVGGSV
jgi:hypothetical protein